MPRRALTKPYSSIQQDSTCEHLCAKALNPEQLCQTRCTTLLEEVGRGRCGFDGELIAGALEGAGWETNDRLKWAARDEPLSASRAKCAQDRSKRKASASTPLWNLRKTNQNQ